MQVDRLGNLVPVAEVFGELGKRTVALGLEQGLASASGFCDLDSFQDVELLVVVAEGPGSPISNQVLPGVSQALYEGAGSGGGSCLQGTLDQAT